MDWSIIEKVTNHPVFLALVSVGSIIAGILLIISKTSWGRKAIEKLTKLGERVENKVNENRKYISEKVEEINTVKQEIVDFKEEAKNDIKVYFAQLDFFEGKIFDLFNEFPNEKVKAKAKLFQDEWKAKKEEIKNYIGVSYSQVEEKIDTINAEKDHQIAILTSEMAKLKELIKNLQNSKESGENEQRETTTNEETREE